MLALDSASGPGGTRGRKDLSFCRASLVDAHGTVVADAWENVAFGAAGGVRLVGANPFSTDAGIASILIERDGRDERATVFALAVVSGKPMSASLGLGGTAVASQRSADGKRSGDRGRRKGRGVARGRCSQVPHPDQCAAGSAGAVSSLIVTLNEVKGTISGMAPFTPFRVTWM